MPSKGLHVRTHMMLSQLYGRAEVGTVLIRAHPASQDRLSNIVIEPLIAAGDTKGIIIQGVAAPLSNISVSNAVIRRRWHGG
jgi:hypothetical protein